MPDINDLALPEETLAQAMNRITRSRRGDTYQNGVRPGPKKLEQFREVMAMRGVPALYEQDGKGDDSFAFVKLFDPCGSWTWYITEFSRTAPDGIPDLAFGLVDGFEEELGYIDLNELANTRGKLGIGIEIDMHWKPRLLSECYKNRKEAVANEF